MKTENNLNPGDKWLFQRGYNFKPGIVLKSIKESKRVKFLVRFLDNNGESWTYARPLRKDNYQEGEKLYNGAKPVQRLLDNYNDIQKDINRHISQGVEVPERLISWSHKYFWMMSEIAELEN